MKGRDIVPIARAGLAAVLLAGSAFIRNNADEMVVPKQYATAEGPGGNSVFDNTRQVVVYSADLFADVPEGGGYLEGVTFRFNQSSIPYSVDATVEFEMLAGVTSRHPHDFLPRTEFSVPFSILEGRSDEVVFPRAMIHIKDTILPNTVNPFDIHIPFSTPYRYNPASAHLYLDIRTYEKFALFMDGTRAQVDGVVSLHGTTEFYDVRRPGIVALFHFTPIPEPSAVTIAIASLLVLLGHRTKWLGGGRAAGISWEKGLECGGEGK